MLRHTLKMIDDLLNKWMEFSTEFQTTQALRVIPCNVLGIVQIVE